MCNYDTPFNHHLSARNVLVSLLTISHFNVHFMTNKALLPLTKRDNIHEEPVFNPMNWSFIRRKSFEFVCKSKCSTHFIMYSVSIVSFILLKSIDILHPKVVPKHYIYIQMAIAHDQNCAVWQMANGKRQTLFFYKSNSGQVLINL